MTQFTFEETDLDFGTYSLTGDWTLTIETRDGGHTFKLVDAESCLKGVSRACFALIQEWIEDDLAPRQRKADHKSRIRAAFNDHVWRFENVSAAYHVEPPVDLSLIGRRVA